MVRHALREDRESSNLAAEMCRTGPWRYIRCNLQAVRCTLQRCHRLCDSQSLNIELGFLSIVSGCKEVPFTCHHLCLASQFTTRNSQDRLAIAQAQVTTVRRL